MSHRNQSHRNQQPIQNRSAFTLIEVLLVLIILVVLGSLAINIVMPARDKANIDAAKSQGGFVKSGIDLYRLHVNRFPSQLEDLWVEPSDSAQTDQWQGPYLDKLSPDPWGNPYQYLSEGKKNPKGFDFWSMGPDGQDGTDDDIGNWDKEAR